MNDREMIKKVADTMYELVKIGTMCNYDYLTRSIYELQFSFVAILPVLRHSGRIETPDIEYLTSAIRSLHASLLAVTYSCIINTVSENTIEYRMFKASLDDVKRERQLNVDSNWDNNNPGNRNMISEAMGCASAILDCAKSIEKIIHILE